MPETETGMQVRIMSDTEDQCRAAFEATFRGDTFTQSEEAATWRGWQAAWNADRWQPISEAPKDGTPLLALWNAGIYKGSIHNDNVALVQFIGGVWQTFGVSDPEGCNEPTHFQPLSGSPQT